MWSFRKKTKKEVHQAPVDYLSPSQQADLHEVALRVIKNQKERETYEADCVEAHLCPMCGAVLKDWDEELGSSPESGVACVTCKFRKVTETW